MPIGERMSHILSPRPGEMDFKENVVRLLTQPATPDAGYYCFGLLIGDRGPEWTIQTEWCGYTEAKPHREIRKASLFDGESLRSFLRKIGHPALLINEERDLQYFYGFGGYILVIEQLGSSRFPHLLGPDVMRLDSLGVGFRSESSLTPSQLQHAPSKKLRMEILTRDGRRCLICGRSPMYYVDVELHVHHAVPWGVGGITEPANLITLCKTCHDGLDPHFDPDLTKYLSAMYPTSDVRYFKKLCEYNQFIRNSLSSVA